MYLMKGTIEILYNGKEAMSWLSVDYCASGRKGGRCGWSSAAKKKIIEWSKAA